MSIEFDLAALSTAEIALRLSHVTAEVRKTTFDFWIFTCPNCERSIKLDYLHFTGQGKFGHECGAAFKFNFEAVAKQFAGQIRELDYDEASLKSNFPSLYH